MHRDIEIVTAADRPDLADEAARAFREKWPEFIFHDPLAPKYLSRVEEYFARYDVLVLDEGAVVAGGWAVPMPWDGSLADLPDGYDGHWCARSSLTSPGMRPAHCRSWRLP